MIDLEFEVPRNNSSNKRARSAYKSSKHGESVCFFDREDANYNSPFEVVARARKESRSKDR